MARPRRRAAARAALLAAGLLLGPAPAAAVDLEGTWHVLVHYRDAGSEKPERKHWEDLVWVFERRGDRLRWTEYPIVVFRDHSGRFESLGGNRARRILGFWEPNAEQRAQIAEGLEVNERGQAAKTLRGGEGEGWSSGEGSGYRSARYLTYEETWTIEGLPDAPVFRQSDVLGGAAAESLEGRTVYATERVAEGGDVLRGRYSRDGRREGRFRLRRAAPVRGVEGSGMSAGERVYEAFFGEAAGQLFRGEMPGGASEAELREAARSGSLGEDGREALRETIRADLEEQYRSQGNDPRAHRAAIESLARKIERQFVEEGRSFEEIRAMIRRGELRP